MEAHNALTRGVLRPLINAPGATGESGVAAVLKRAAGDIERNLHLHQREILAHLNALAPNYRRPVCLSLQPGSPMAQVWIPHMIIFNEM